MATDLSNMISDLTNLEQNRLILMATIYTRKLDTLRKEKVNEFKNYLMDQLMFYKRDEKKYSEKFDSLIKTYETNIDKVIEQYETEYKYLQNEIAFAETNQKISIANCIASKRGLIKATSDNNKILIEKSNKKIYATAQKKLNYDVVIYEGIARLEKCINDTYSALDEIFNVSNNKLAIPKNGIWNKIKRFFMINFSGNSSFEKNIMEPLEAKMKNIEVASNDRIAEIKIEMLNYIAQFEKIRGDINDSFNETLNKAS